MPNATLSKSERLNSKKTITGLFQKGSSLFTYPFKFVYTPVKPDSVVPVQILFSVVHQDPGRVHLKQAMEDFLLKPLLPRSIVVAQLKLSLKAY